ncbi:MAG: hypothetical protein LBE11_03535 [Prevotellaceae bacterium]|jgi:hypothetical protein|nr:hypothetical protein [Prevotellaceae bacterium]
MKKLILLLSIMLICFENFAQTNSKGVLKKDVFQLNNGIRLSKGDTIMLGIPANAANRFTYVYEPLHAFGLLGGNGADLDKSYKMFIIHYFTITKDKVNNEKKVIASLGYGKQETVLDCEIAEAIEYGEVIAKGRVPQRFNIAVKDDVEKKKVHEQPKQLLAEKSQEQLKHAEPETEKTVANTEENTLLGKINELNKNKDITDSEHYQLLKLVTSGNSENIDNKKELVKTLQSLRDNKKLEIEYYDKIIDLLLQ